MARITWKNVAAPNTGDVVRQQAIASRMINDGATGIGSTLQDLQTNSNRKLSAGAMQELGQIQDIGKFDELMKNGGLSQLGISADRASPELNEMLQGYRDTLAGNRQDDFDFTQDKVEAGRDSTRFDNAQLVFDQGQIDRTETRVEEAETKAEQERLEALTSKARGIADRVSGRTGSREEAKLQVLNQFGDDPEMVRALLTQIDEQPEIIWSAGKESAMDRLANNDPDSLRGAFQTEIQRQESELWVKAESNPLTKAWAEGQKRYQDAGSPVEGLIANVRGISPGKVSENESTFNRSEGEIQRQYTRLVDKYDLPESVIAAAMEDNLRSTGIGWMFNNKRTFDFSDIESKLDDLNTTKGRAELNRLVSSQERQRTRLADMQAADLELQQRQALAARRGNDPLVAELQAKRDELYASIGSQPENSNGSGNSDTGSDNGTGGAQESQQIPEPNASLQRALDAATGQGEVGPPVDDQAAEIYSNPVVADVRGEIGDQANKAWETVQDTLRAADRGAGRLADAGAEFLGTRADRLGKFASTFSPGIGTDMFNLADRLRGFTDNAAQNGIFGSAEGLDEEQAARDVQIAEGFQEERPELAAQQERLDELRAATEGMTPEEAAPIIKRMREEEAAATAEPRARVPQGPRRPRQEPNVPQDASGRGLGLPNRTTPVPTGNNGPRTPEIMEEPTSPYETVPGFDSTNPRAGGNSPLAQTSPETGIPGSDALLEEAAQNPASALEAVLDEANLSSAESQEVEESLAIMQSGQFIRPEFKEQMQARLKEILEKAAQKRGGNNPQDPIAQLLANPEKWLNL